MSHRSSLVVLAAAAFAAACGGGEPGTGPGPTTTPVSTVTIGGNVTQPIERTVTVPLTATTRDASNGLLTGRVVAWSSSAPTVASVDAATGVVTALDRGTATITATSETKTATTEIEVIILYRSIAAGDGFTCDLGSIGMAHCWGENGGQDGRLGNGPLDNASLANSSVPVNVLGTPRFTQISSGARHSCGVTSAGAAHCWGGNGSGQLGNTANPSWAHQPVLVAGTQTYSQISAGDTHTCALTTTGAAYCWGENGSGQLGNNSTTDSNVPVAVSGGHSFTNISAGSEVTCAVATTGAAYCWGSDTYGMIGNGGEITYSTTDIRTTPTSVVQQTTWKQVAVGTFHVCGVLVSGTGYCWGDNSSGHLGIGDPNVFDSSSPLAVNTSVLFSQIESGYFNSCGVTTTFALHCWGANVSGESGSATAVGQIAYSPALAASGEWIEVNLGGTSPQTCAITRNRLSVRCMGNNDSGQLGNNTTTNSNTANPTMQQVFKQTP
jgi:alpha-tubulin suppressor-like RCC1 family protein